MSIIKRLSEEKDEQYRRGLDMCLQAGALSECDGHPGAYFRGDSEISAAHKLAKTDSDHEAVEIAYYDNCSVDECQSCERNMQS
jgi:hypothetical protein